MFHNVTMYQFFAVKLGFQVDRVLSAIGIGDQHFAEIAVLVEALVLAQRPINMDKMGHWAAKLQVLAKREAVHRNGGVACQEFVFNSSGYLASAGDE